MWEGVDVAIGATLELQGAIFLGQLLVYYNSKGGVNCQYPIPKASQETYANKTGD